MDVGLDKIQLNDKSAMPSVVVGDYDNDGATDLLITQNHGPAVLLKNEGGNKNHWLRLAHKGLNDNKSAIGTKVEVFAGGNRQKFEIYGSNGYLGQNSPYLTVGLGDAKEADIVRMLWPTGVLQDEIQVAGDKQQDFLELDRRGSSCPTLFVWNGDAGRPSLFIRLGLAMLRQPKRTCVGVATLDAWTTTFSPSMVASAGTYLPSSPAISNSLSGLPSREARPPAVWANVRRILLPSTFIDLYSGPE